MLVLVLFILLGIPQADQLHNCHTYIEGLDWPHADALCVSPDSVLSYESRLVVSVGSLVMTLTPPPPPPGSENPFSFPLAGYLELSTVLACGSLHLFRQLRDEAF